MKERYIDNDGDLAAFCNAAVTAPYLAVDTEFISGRTYHPKLAMIQMCDGNDIALVDALKVTDPGILAQLFRSLGSPSIMHAPEQDVRILKRYCGAIPGRIYDTQLAAAFLGSDLQMSYRELVEGLLNVRLNKEMRHSDWSRRPLHPRQLEYAANDVRYLIPLWKTLEQRLRSRRRLSWLLEDIEANSLRYREDAVAPPVDAYTDMLNWRNEQARRLDLPPNWIVSNQDMRRIVKLKEPTGKAIEGILSRTRHRRIPVQEILDALLSSLERYSRSGSRKPIATHLLEHAQRALSDVAERYDVAPALIIRRKDLPSLIDRPWMEGGKQDRSIRGWRTPMLQAVLSRVRRRNARDKAAQRLTGLIRDLSPGRWLIITRQDVPSGLSALSPAPEIHSPGGYLRTERAGRRFDVGVVWQALSDSIDGEEANLLARLRDVDCGCLFVYAPSASERRLAELGFLPLTSSMEEGGGLFVYDIARYKRTPDWLNDKHWANPERWNKERW